MDRHKNPNMTFELGVSFCVMIMLLSLPLVPSKDKNISGPFY